KQVLSEAEGNGSKFALIFIDLNRFKPVNDQYGHDAGDLLLRKIGQRLCTSVRKADLVARMGGDEFILLLDRIRDDEDTAQIMDKVRDAVERPCQLTSELTVKVSAAMGVAIYPDDGVFIDELLNTADHLMYRDKRVGVRG
ncbi:MAG: GGDEF domain-containing protein, partial [Candidatus Electrothrix sp. AR3]|nr:GGDEF domain-containing protein [Candidatus Electrothrix sp. AR3]